MITAKYIIHDFLKLDIPVTQTFGNNLEYYKQFGFNGHEGVDFATINGTEFFAPFDGIIVRAGIDVPAERNYGEFIVVWDPKQKIAIWFCHLQDFLCKEGDEVKQGDLLGHTNNTGNTTGPHVHVNFCETDDKAMRINLDNGYKGFLDIMDPNLVAYPWLPVVPVPLVPQANADSSIPLDPHINPATGQWDDNFANNHPEPAKYTEAQYAEIIRQKEEAALQLQATTQDNIDLNKKLSGFVALGYNSIDDVQKILKQKDTDNLGLQKQILQLKQSRITLLDQFKAVDQEDITALDMGVKAADELKTLKVDHEEAIKAIQPSHPDLPHVLSAIDRWKTLVAKAINILEKDHVVKTENVAAVEGQGKQWLAKIVAYLTLTSLCVGYIVFYFLERR